MSIWREKVIWCVQLQMSKMTNGPPSYTAAKSQTAHPELPVLAVRRLSKCMILAFPKSTRVIMWPWRTSKTSALTSRKRQAAGAGSILATQLHGQVRLYVDQTRISQLKNLSSQKLDLTKLIELCEELNRCDSQECFLAVATLVRAIIDHVPPIFGCKSFGEVANSYNGV
jgi:hypothetical protein